MPRTGQPARGLPPLVSVIVPVLNEAGTVAGVLDHLASLTGRWELLVIDGGSTDQTVELAGANSATPRVLGSRRGRAVQMNAGAAQATGEVLLFLHADTRLPADAYAQLVGALENDAVAGGNFRLEFDGGDRFSRLLGRVYGAQRRLGVYYGDSAVWVRRPAFEALGGYRELAIMEDYELVRRLERCSETVCLRGPVLTSARRWQRLGLARTVASWVVIRWLFIAGVPPARLAGLYRTVR